MISGIPNLKRFLDTNAEDAGCAQTFALMHVYIERELSHADAAKLYPGIAEHFASCGPCAEDYRGIRALVA
jgi:hypothetical protein